MKRDPNDRSAAARELPGGVYCAPWCGFGCRKAAYERAVREADLLAGRMGEGWQPEVWENCGWHYKITKGVASIHPSIKGSSIDGSYTVLSYLIFFNTSKQVVKSAPTPEEALQLAVSESRGAADKIIKDITVFLG